MHTTNKVIFISIICLPILDIATFFTINLPISIGIIVRTALLIFLLIHLVRHFSATYFPILIALISISITFMLNFFMKENFFIYAETTFLFKTMYLLMMLYMVIYLRAHQLVKKSTLFRATTIASLLIGITYWMALLTGTSRASYHTIQNGFSGWFFSANELSVISLILLSLSLIIFQEKKSLSTASTYIILVSTLPLIGTKTALYGGLMLILAYIFFEVFTWLCRGNVLQKSQLAVIMIGFIFFIPVFITDEQHSQATEQEIQQTRPLPTENLLSSRDIYLENTRHDYAQAHLTRKLFGLGLGGDYEIAPKTIEMDFHDLFFSYGISGGIAFLFVAWMLVKTLRPRIWTVTVPFILTSILLCLAIAALAGHVLFAPAVMSYLALLLLCLAVIHPN